MSWRQRHRRGLALVPHMRGSTTSILVYGAFGIVAWPPRSAVSVSVSQPPPSGTENMSASVMPRHCVSCGGKNHRYSKTFGGIFLILLWWSRQESNFNRNKYGLNFLNVRVCVYLWASVFVPCFKKDLKRFKILLMSWWLASNYARIIEIKIPIWTITNIWKFPFKSRFLLKLFIYTY